MAHRAAATQAVSGPTWVRLSASTVNWEVLTPTTAPQVASVDDVRFALLVDSDHPGFIVTADRSASILSQPFQFSPG